MRPWHLATGVCSLKSSSGYRSRGFTRTGKWPISKIRRTVVRVLPMGKAFQRMIGTQDDTAL